MRKAQIKANISKPRSALGFYAAIALGGVAAFAGLVGLLAYVMSGSSGSERDFITQDGIPDDFWARRAFMGDEETEEVLSAPPAVAEREEKEPAAEEPPKAPSPPPQAAPASQKTPERPAQERRTVRVEPVRRVLVEPVHEPQEDPAVVAARERVNASRRGAGMMRLARQTEKETIEWDAEDEDWKRYGVPQEEASYPRDMSRLITQDRRIRCVLIEEINSQLAGDVSCQVEQSVYGAHGRLILIPAGSRAIGHYSPLERIGDDRVPIWWSRIITPEGINITLEDAAGVDQMGRSGIGGDLDRRYSERYGISLLFSLVTTMAQLSVPMETTGERIIINNAARDTSDLARIILEDQVNIQPRLRVPAGTRLQIQPSRDIYFQEPVRRIVRVSEAGERR